MKKLYLLFLLTIIPLLAYADAVEINGLYYNLVENAKVAEVTSSPNKYSGDIVIPEKVTYDGVEYDVTSIGDAAFGSCTGLTSVTIPTSVTSIKPSTFEGCSNLSTIEIPNSVTSIGLDAFTGTAWLGNQPNGLLYVGKVLYAYIGEMSDNTMISIDEGTTSIVGNAFKDCKGLVSVTIPNSVTCIGAYTFWGCSNLSSIEIPNSVTSIGSYCFANCSSLTSLTIPNSVTSFDAGVFFGCSGLTSVSIPNSWTSIPVETFHFCSNLTTIEIPSSVTGIGVYAFCGCTNLSSITCLAVTPPGCDFDSFGNHEIPLYVPDGSIDSYKTAYEWKRFTNILPISSAPEYDAVKIGDSGYGSFCSTSDLDFTDVDGLKAYTATGYDDDNGSIWLTRIYHVPAGTGLIVKGTPGTTYQVPHKSTHSYYSNMLVGNTGSTITIYETDGDKTNYYLKSGKLLKVDGYATIGQYKSYLQVPTSVFVRTRSIDFILDDESGTTYVPHIVQPDETTDVYYNLNGQRVKNPGKGLYIKNGKKVVIK